MHSNEVLALLWRRRTTLVLVFVACCVAHALMLFSQADYYVSDALVQVREHDGKPGRDALSGAQIYEKFTRELLERWIEAPGFALAVKGALRMGETPHFAAAWRASSVTIEREEGSDFHKISYLSHAPDEVVPALKASLSALCNMSQGYFDQGLKRVRERLTTEIQKQQEAARDVEVALLEIRDSTGIDVEVSVEEQVAVLAESIETLDLQFLELRAACDESRQLLELLDRGTAGSKLSLVSQRNQILSSLKGTPLFKAMNDVTGRLIEAELRVARSQERFTEAHPERIEAEHALAREQRIYESFFEEDSPFAAQIQEALSSVPRARDRVAITAAQLVAQEGRIQETERLLEGKRQRLATLQSVKRSVQDLRTRRSVVASKVAALEGTLQQVELYANLAPDVVQVFRQPTAPHSLGRELPLSFTLVFLFATLSSLAACYLLEYFDHRIHAPQTFELCSTLPLLGTMTWQRGGAKAPRDLQQGSIEELNVILKKLMVHLPRPAVLLVTGCEAGAGKSTLSFQLGQRAGEFGLKTLLIDADLRQPRAAEYFGLPEEPGLTDRLRGHLRTPLSSFDGVAFESSGTTRVRPDQVPRELSHQELCLLQGRSFLGRVVNATTHSNLWVLPSGSVDRDPAVSLSSSSFADLLRESRRQYDLCIIDSPPLTVVSDALLMAPHADGTLLVARAGLTTTHALNWVKRQLADIEVPVLGAVLNGMRKHSRSDYNYRMQLRSEDVEV